MISATVITEFTCWELSRIASSTSGDGNVAENRGVFSQSEWWAYLDTATQSLFIPSEAKNLSRFPLITLGKRQRPFLKLRVTHRDGGSVQMCPGPVARCVAFDLAGARECVLGWPRLHEQPGTNLVGDLGQLVPRVIRPG